MDAELENKSDNIIQLKKDENIKRFEIYDYDGNPTGEFLEFDLEDIELPIKIQEIIEEDKKARTKFKFKIDEIERRPDKKGKKLMSANEEAKIRATQEFYHEQVRLYNMFLGDNAVEKILCGRKITWTTLDAINGVIKNQIYPELKKSFKNIKDQIKEKYGEKKDDIIE